MSRSATRSSSGRTLYLVASIRNSRCSSASFSGCSAARSLRLRPVGRRVVELPDVVVEGRLLLADQHPGNAVLRHGGPALVVDAAVAEHLEVLRRVPLVRRRRRRRSRPCSRPRAASAGRRARTSARGARPPRAPSGRRRSRARTGERISPRALMPAGQWTIVPLRVPPQCEATCFVHWYGAHIACAQPTA